MRISEPMMTATVAENGWYDAEVNAFCSNVKNPDIKRIIYKIVRINEKINEK